jgi:hypothetical protein
LPRESFRDHPARAELRRLYDELDALLAHLSCDATAECCDFDVFGREPYPTAVEAAELELALRGAPIARDKRPPPIGRDKQRLPIARRARTCPVLGDGRCRAYAARPFGCRTFFCHRVAGGRVPREEVQRIARKIADLSERFAPREPGPRDHTRPRRSRRPQVTRDETRDERGRAQRRGRMY